ncbi:flagellar basal body P-ring formation chaperone FlgA [Microbulbifer epialgicus]|uniref:Flagellar basal body P-ring formation chaperone FlgA n=1 Tax=Microbulbifer epialgicus TaxID=393907 RepID=A0ABV4NY58_9GAMM
MKQYKHVVIVFMAASFAVAEEIKIKLHPIINQKSKAVLLSEIGEISSKLEKNKEILIPGNLQRDRTERGYWVDKSDLSSLIMALYPQHHLNIFGPDKIKVNCPLFNLDMDVVNLKVKKVFHSKVEAGSELSIVPYDNIPEVNLCAEPDQIVIKRFSKGKIKSREAVNVSLESKGRVIYNFPLWLKIAHYDTVLQAASSYRKGTYSDKVIVKEKYTDIAKLTHTPIETIPQGMRLKNHINTSEVITTDDFELIPSVEMGRSVVILSVVKNITIVAKGKAKSDGDLGDLILVQLENGENMFEGKVIRKDTVLVQGEM